MCRSQGAGGGRSVVNKIKIPVEGKMDCTNLTPLPYPTIPFHFLNFSWDFRTVLNLMLAIIHIICQITNRNSDSIDSNDQNRIMIKSISAHSHFYKFV